MSTISTLIGEVIDPTPVKSLQLDGEIFYAIKVRFRECEIPVLISQFLTSTEYSGKIAVTGYYMVYHEKGSKDSSHFFVANSIEPVAIDAEISNEISIDVRVTKVTNLKPNKRGVDVLPLIAADYTPFHTTSIMYLCARGKAARQLCSMQAPFQLKSTGYLKQYRDIYEILIMEVNEV